MSKKILMRIPKKIFEEFYENYYTAKHTQDDPSYVTGKEAIEIAFFKLRKYIEKKLKQERS